MRSATKHPEQYRAIEYLRLSKEKKGERNESDSITNQRKIIADFVKYHPEIEIVDSKVDDGYTGTDFDRPGFKQLLAEMKRKKINCILVKDLSRFGRDYIECGRYIEREFALAGIRFVAVNDGVDTHGEFSESNRYMIPVKNLMNDMYSAGLSLKIRSVNDSLRRNGEFIGAFPVYGYRRSEKNSKQLIIDDYPAQIVKQIFSWRLKGWSYSAIADELNLQGVKSPLEYKKTMGAKLKTKFAIHSESKWSAQAVKRILHNRVYTGRLEQKKVTTINYKVKNRIALPEDEWICKDNAHSPIIEIRDFEIVNALDANGTTNPDNLFSGIIECGCCKGEMKYQTVPGKNGRVYKYYFCSNCKGKKAVRISMDSLVKTAELTLRAHISTMIQELDRLIKDVGADEIRRIETKHIRVRIAELETEKKKIRDYLESVSEDYVDGIISREEAAEYRNVYEQRLEETQNNIIDLETEISSLDTAMADKKEKLAYFLSYQNFESIDRQLAIMLIQSIKVKSKKEIEFVFSWDDEFRHFSDLISAQKGGSDNA